MTSRRLLVVLVVLAELGFGEPQGLHSVFPRNAELKTINERCVRNSECPSGAFCHVTCRCKSTHVPISNQCWKKIDPGVAGCTYHEQCDAVWPGTRCEHGVCHCQPHEKLVHTREGSVCVVPGACPTNGVHGALYDRATNRVSTCLTFVSKKDNSQFIGCDEYPEVYDCIAGVCCPTRGLTCILPMSEGEHLLGSKEEIRWYYDPVVGRCDSFNYLGKGGNSNNFLTQLQCESYCMNRCPRGDPLVLSNSENSVRINADNYHCSVKEGDQLQCCPTPSFICSSMGGVNVEAHTIRSFSNGSPRRMIQMIHRWYWDSSGHVCKQFKYYGQGGNFNNFETKADCTKFCGSDLCAHGSPLRDPSENVQRCSTSERCPETHECRHSFCCPKPSTVCSVSLAARDDACEPRESLLKWTYSLEHGMCKSVMVSSCLHGDNQFETLEACESVCASIQPEPKCPIGRALRTPDNVVQRCATSKPCPPNYECVYSGTNHACCPSREYACKQSMTIGTTCGVSTLHRWHYDAGKNKCVSFEYLGCGGNDNNFATRLDCVETCQKFECADGGDPLVDSTTGAIIECSRDDEDCPSTHTCSRMLYQNRTACCPNRKWVCSHDADEGVACGAPSTRFHFDAATETCRQFEYLGCGGNSNSFSSRVACYQYCQSSSCASSEIVYQPSNLDEPFDCSLKPCPRHFACVKSVWDETRSVCCGNPNFGVCPSTQHPMIDYSSQQPMVCAPNVKDSCPLDFQCVYSSIRALYFCCRDNTRVDKCLKGSRPEVWTTTAETRACSRHSQCGDATRCFAPVPYTSGVCCASIDAVCPATFVYEAAKSALAECSPLMRHSCGGDGQSVCIYAEAKARFVCCRREPRASSSLDKCPPGSVPEPTRHHCDPEHPCAATHFCMKKAADRSGICCRHPHLKRTNPKPKEELARCPNGERAFADDDGNLQVCAVDADCPPLHSCVFQKGLTAVCCGVDDPFTICASGVLPTSRVKKCAMCAPEHTCHRNYCCPANDLVCSLPPPHPINDNSGKLRYFFDSETNTCRSFVIDEAAPPPQNAFSDHSACIRACVYEPSSRLADDCPLPYTNPDDHPQYCVIHRKSCDDNETCVLSRAGGAYVCCRKPPTKNLVCGDNYLPQLDRNGAPMRCETSAQCASKICAKSSTSPTLTICCRRVRFKPAARLDDTEQPIANKCVTKLYPGEIGCTSNEQCVGSTCVNSTCRCSQRTVLFRKMCASSCPPFYRAQNGVCV
ncbi:unnamed protein product [Caenorhabditis bovis]|uniref:BPTI/Kunitz inhibitor domain-containing protein n=1 Tax=Caenorhabditis bovis TaxID=2654633 RepID=A0A8S1ENX6_9PELO|nr:unnamed protein product [Caenorhabditis bovis]